MRLRESTKMLLTLVSDSARGSSGEGNTEKAVRALGLVSPMMRALVEMSYEFDETFILDTTKFTSTFGAAGTPLARAVSETVAWYRTRVATP